MNNKQFGITVLGVSIGVICFVWGVLWMMMCIDYKEQVNELKKENRQLEQEIIDYKWVLSQTDQMICIKE